MELMAGYSPVWAGTYVSGSLGGVLGGLEGVSTGFRLGDEIGAWDGSIGYERASGSLYSSKLLSDSADLHTISLEGYRIIPFQSDLKFKVGGGLGYSILNISSVDKADNDVSFILGGSAEYTFTDNWSVGTNVKGTFFNTNTHRTTYSSHNETLSTGQEVEVLDTNNTTNSVNFNNVSMGLAVKYSF